MSDEVTTPQPKKRGRKPNPQKKGYFYDEEEQAFQDYVNSTDKVFRDRIFAQKLFPAFTKMIESIIRRYGLFVPLEDFDDTFYDTMSFLITKINNFDNTKGCKLYSYCGTVCKNYLLLKRKQAMKKMENEMSYDLMFNGGLSDNRSENNSLFDDDTINNTKLIQNTIIQLQEFLNEENIQTLTDNEIKVGYALLEILTNWEDIFKRLNGNKFNKTCVLFFLKETTMLDTKSVRDAMKKYKDLYLFTKQKMITE